MATTLSEKYIKSAKRKHLCNACEWIRMGGTFNELVRDYPKLTFSEKRALALAKENGYYIHKGSPYIKQSNKEGSEIWTFKAIPEIHAICVKHDLYDF